MTFNEFRTKVKKLNPNIQMKPWKWWASAVYVYKPMHPDADPDTGLLHITSIPSPRLYSSIPSYTQKVHPSAKRYDELAGWEPDKVRGWIPAIQMLITKGIVSKSDAIKLFGRVS